MSHLTNKWTKEKIHAFLEREELAYQKIDLPYGLSTPGQARPELCDVAFGDDLSGKTVLDVGSYLGYFCLAACERGAKQVVGLEVDPLRVQQARTLAEIKGFTPEYRTVDIEQMDSQEQFDVVLCLNVLHHMFDPVHTLHKLIRMACQTLVLEVAGFGGHDAAKLGIGYTLRRRLQKTPIIYAATGLPLLQDRNASQKFFFSPEALVNILANHHKVFSRIEVMPSTFKGRFIIKATRRQIKHLIVVSGPTSSGKSTTMRMLSGGQLPLDIDKCLPANTARWPQIGANRFLSGRYEEQPFLHQAMLEGLVLHYDILRPYRSGTHSYERDQALDLLQCAKKVTVIILKPDSAQLVEQLIRGELKGDTSGKKRSMGRLIRLLAQLPGKVPPALLNLFVRLPGVEKLYRFLVPEQPSRYHQKLLVKYQQPQWLTDWYQRWESYLRHRVPDADIIEMNWDSSAKDSL